MKTINFLHLKILSNQMCVHRWSWFFLSMAIFNWKDFLMISFPVGNYMFKFNNRNTRTRYLICSKLTIKTRRQWRRSGAFIINSEDISHLVSIVNFEQVNVGWDDRTLFWSQSVTVSHWIMSLKFHHTYFTI